MSDIQLVPGLSRLTYAHQPQHAFLADGFGRPEGPNIGANGENLTIMFLSMDRVWMSERLCRSVAEHIPHFKGELLAIDNGSQPSELARLYEMLESIPLRTRVVEMGENFGVAGGRNRGVPHVTTDWVMSIDNDIYFTRDPFRHWQSEIARLGCRFFSLALYNPDQQTVFLRGGNLYVNYADGDVHLGGGSAGDSADGREVAGEPFLGTCMMGGAAIFDRKLFTELGGFDDNMFVGFEDIEFSLRLFREGYKIGCSALAALVHDHAKPETEVDREYEKIRFRRNYLEESAQYFEGKHGFRVWDRSCEEWLTQREHELGLDVQPKSAVATPALIENGGGAAKPKILLVPDTVGWAFSNIAGQIEKHLSYKYDVTVAAVNDLDHPGQIMLLARGMDLVHVFWRGTVGHLFDEHMANYGRVVGFSNPDDYFGLLRNTRLTTSVYDHLFLDGEEAPFYRDVLTNVVDSYFTSSRKLDAIYREFIPEKPPAAIIQDGVCTNRFQPKNLERLMQTDRPLRIGWVGNSKWSFEREDFKGLHSIIEPALEQLRAEGLTLETRFADRHVAYISHEMMPDYYASIDVLLCSSKIEGTPNPVLEAMACGVPVISTDVGIVPEAFGPLQSQFILPERSVGAMMDAIRRLDGERHLLPRLSAENLARIPAWDWAERVKKFEGFFDSVLARDRTAARAA